jgi:hypothetical protein
MRLKIENVRASGRRTGWSKRVENVDESKENGYAFDGEFLPDRKEIEIPVGAIVIQKNPKGSVKNGYNEGKIYRVSEEGSLVDLHPEVEFNWRNDFLTFRDHVAEAINGVESSELSKYTNEELIAELKKRGKY